jgi:hypothetical protein
MSELELVAEDPDTLAAAKHAVYVRTMATLSAGRTEVNLGPQHPTLTIDIDPLTPR